MNSHTGYRDRRSNSQLLPRIYLLLEFLILSLLSYMFYMTATTLGMSENLIFTILSVINTYYIFRLYSKCKNISK
ncbi:MAG: hypothetical protein U9O86_02375, partial [Campylobacterota bacterium]|nr:hypothetical protein [Campylobacterota bacterium]